MSRIETARAWTLIEDGEPISAYIADRAEAAQLAKGRYRMVRATILRERDYRRLMAGVRMLRTHRAFVGPDCECSGCAALAALDGKGRKP